MGYYTRVTFFETNLILSRIQIMVVHFILFYIKFGGDMHTAKQLAVKKEIQGQWQKWGNYTEFTLNKLNDPENTHYFIRNTRKF